MIDLERLKLPKNKFVKQTDVRCLHPATIECRGGLLGVGIKRQFVDLGVLINRGTLRISFCE